MATLNTGISVLKPQGFSPKQIRVDIKKLFVKLADALAEGSAVLAGKPDALPKMVATLVGSIEAFSKETPLETLAWQLIYRALTRAVSELVLDAAIVHAPSSPALTALAGQCDVAISQSDTKITDAFLSAPGSIPLLNKIEEHLKNWGRVFGLSQAESLTFSSRLRTYFTYALNDEWQKNSQHYQPLVQALQSPFGTATQHERDWAGYMAWLDKQIALPVFGEVFSLSNVYVPLRAYFLEEEDKNSENSGFQEAAHAKQDHTNKPTRQVVDLHGAVRAWLNSTTATDAIRIISGGPGSGKSSFLRKLAADLASEDPTRPIYIPLQRFSLSTDLTDAIGRYLRDAQFFKENPFHDPDTGSPPIVLLLDGLDELAKPGAVADEVAKEFLIELHRSVHLLNTQRLRCLAIVTGRTIAIQKSKSAIRPSGQQQLYVMKYVYSETERKEYKDNDKLLEIDQRTIWWEKYSSAKGITKKTPDTVLNAELVELSAEPLLLYLLVLSNFHQEEHDIGVNRNAVYRRLLGGVHKRQYDTGPFKATQGLSEDDFAQIMETIAVAAWYGDGRTATLEDIRERCNTKKLREILETFLSGGAAGINRLIAAFYFQAAENVRKDEAFEFTHKSFGEYLTARRIVRALDRIAKDLNSDQSEKETPFDEMSALATWNALCGRAPISDDLVRFIRDEIAMDDWASRVSEWQDSLLRMINHALKSGMPLSRDVHNLGKHLQYARNSEEALWCAANACARLSKRLLDVEWPSEIAAGDLLHRLRGQRWPPEPSVIMRSLSYVSFDKQTLAIQDFFNADLANSTFIDAKLVRTELSISTLDGANLTRARIQRADLQGSNLVAATLDGIFGHGASLEGVTSPESSWKKADLEKADLSEGRFDDANFEDANLEDAILTGASFRRANFRNAKLKDAVCSHADFEDCKFDYANLEGADFEGAHFKNSSFADANLSSANFREAFMDASLLPVTALNEVDISGIKPPDEFESNPLFNEIEN